MSTTTNTSFTLDQFADSKSSNDMSYYSMSLLEKDPDNNIEYDVFNVISDYMNEFDKVVVYYDNGQEALGAIIDTLLINKTNVERRIDFDHKEKRLFQVSDMLTFVDKIVYKHNNNMELTKAEKYFFSVKDILNIIRFLKPKRWKN